MNANIQIMNTKKNSLVKQFFAKLIVLDPGAKLHEEHELEEGVTLILDGKANAKSQSVKVNVVAPALSILERNTILS